MPGRCVQTFPVYTEEFILDHDLPQMQVSLGRALVPSTVQMWVNGCLATPDGFVYDPMGPSLTVQWILLTGDTLRVTGTPL